MNKVLKNSWALFLGMGFIMMAYGFQGSLLGVRAVQEEFSLTATGFMMLTFCAKAVACVSSLGVFEHVTEALFGFILNGVDRR